MQQYKEVQHGIVLYFFPQKKTFLLLDIAFIFLTFFAYGYCLSDISCFLVCLHFVYNFVNAHYRVIRGSDRYKKGEAISQEKYQDILLA